MIFNDDFKMTLHVVIAATACLFFLMIVVLTGFAQTGKKSKPSQGIVIVESGSLVYIYELAYIF